MSRRVGAAPFMNLYYYFRIKLNKPCFVGNVTNLLENRYFDRIASRPPPLEREKKIKRFQKKIKFISLLKRVLRFTI